MTKQEQIKQLSSRLKAIEQRNTKVEKDKAWETSTIRQITIALLTYAVIVIFFYSVRIPKPFINAIVPTVGFALSTLTLPILKKWWIARQ